VYREAMQWWTGGHPLYDYSRPDETQGQLGFTYPPAGAFVLLPLAYMSSTVSLVAFIVVAVVCVAASVWWLVGPVARRHNLPRTFLFAVAFLLVTGLVPVRLGFDFGQINPVLWALVVFDLAVLAPRRSRFLGVGIGLATAIKLFPGIFIVYLLLTRRLRGTVVAAATAALATLLAHVVAMKDSTTFWTERLLNGDGVGQLHYFMNQSLNGLLAREYLPGAPPKLLWLALVGPVFIYGMWRARRAGLAGDELTGMALTGFVGSLVSPLTWAHHIFWFAPAILAMVDTGTSPASEVAAVRSGLRNRAALLAVSAFVYITVTFNTLEYYEFSLHAPGGWLAIVMGDWYIWVMLVLLALTPIDPARLNSGPDGTTEGPATAVRVGRHVAV
jgi:alpha-1,2-mannosyltransferase